jgi:hypothetical protein
MLYALSFTLKEGFTLCALRFTLKEGFSLYALRFTLKEGFTLYALSFKLRMFLTVTEINHQSNGHPGKCNQDCCVIQGNDHCQT